MKLLEKSRLSNRTYGIVSNGSADVLTCSDKSLRDEATTFRIITILFRWELLRSHLLLLLLYPLIERVPRHESSAYICWFNLRLLPTARCSSGPGIMEIQLILILVGSIHKMENSLSLGVSGVSRNWYIII